MADIEKLESNRSRGIVWVCDVVGSSKHLNDNETAGDLEDFLFRLYWLSMQVVKAADGHFIKWTGDGFLAWFETPLHREAETKAKTVFNAATQLSVLVAVTQLGLTPKSKFAIRHSVTYEQDALITRIKHQGGFESVDIIGRAVVLAFRLCSIKSAFPHLITQGELVHKPNTNQIELFKFKSVIFKPDDYLRYFKGERWGTDSIHRAIRSKWNKKDVSKMLEIASNLSTPPNLNSILSSSGIDISFLDKLLNFMHFGPEWSKEILNSYISGLGGEVFELLTTQTTKDMNNALEEFKKFSKHLREQFDIK
jgi:hypothetical protein